MNESEDESRTNERASAEAVRASMHMRESQRDLQDALTSVDLAIERVKRIVRDETSGQ